MSEKKESKSLKLASSESKKIAKKDWLIVQNDERYDIKKGDDVSNIPAKFLVCLKTEGVI